MLTARVVSRCGVCTRRCGAILSTPARGTVRCFASLPEPKRPDPHEDPTAKAAKSLPDGRLKDLLTNVSAFNKERAERIDSQRPVGGWHARLNRWWDNRGYHSKSANRQMRFGRWNVAIVTFFIVAWFELTKPDYGDLVSNKTDVPVRSRVNGLPIDETILNSVNCSFVDPETQKMVA